MYNGFDVLDEFDDPDEMEKYINFAIEKAIEKKQWDLYLTVYPNMTEKTFKTFEEYAGKKKKEKKTIENKKYKTKEEILLEVENLLNSKQ